MKYNVGLVNVVVFEHTIGHCLKPAVKKLGDSAGYCIRRWCNVSVPRCGRAGRVEARVI